MKEKFSYLPHYDLIRERWAQNVGLTEIAEEIGAGANPKEIKRIAFRMGLEKRWSITAVRIRATSLLRKNTHPDDVIEALRESGICARTIFRIVKEEQAKVVKEREIFYEKIMGPEEPDTTGLVRLCAGHYADPRSAELIMAARGK